ncbi:hypothetical protein H4219_001372 [Mycoemilia scoparia]|uniref:Probable transporter MCH1 n=1 Tax=Mycoemilia scoparia TaxID=417184 RepID=A0A9W8DVH7_9FUNG|nr:hypothetical protein H4219_001372 [Mycoemilia scoparia]
MAGITAIAGREGGGGGGNSGTASLAHRDTVHIKSYLGTCFSMLCAGTTSLFATYGSAFSEILGFNQYETNVVASFGDYAHYLTAPLWGYLTWRIGPGYVTTCAGLLMFLGYAGLSYAFLYFDTPYEHSHHYVATMTLLFALVGVGSKAAYMSGMSTTAHNFRYSQYAGITLGLPNSLYGLATFIFSSIKGKWFESDSGPSRYLFFMACISGVGHLLASRVMVLDGMLDRRNKIRGSETRNVVDGGSEAMELKDLGDVSTETGVLANSSSNVDVDSNIRHVSRQRRGTVSSNGALDSGREQNKQSDESGDENLTESHDAMVDGVRHTRLNNGDPHSTPVVIDRIIDDIAEPGREQLELHQHQQQQQQQHRSVHKKTSSLLSLQSVRDSAVGIFLSSPSAILLLLGLVFTVGPAVTFINNCGTLVRTMAVLSSVKRTPDEIGVLKDKVVATQSLFSFMTRLAVGYLSDIWRTRLRLPRSAFLIAGGLLMWKTHNMIQMITSVNDMTYLSAMTGMSMGIIYTVAPTYVSETWGAENFGVFWGIMSLGPAVGGHVCNLIFGTAWDEGAKRLQELQLKDKGIDSVGTVTSASALKAVCDQTCFVPAFAKTSQIAFVGMLFYIAATLYPILRSKRWRGQSPTGVIS